MYLPDNVKKIIERLKKNGFEAYAVGGCVRDLILGREPGDWDITTSAKPEEVKALFSHTIDTGIKHGTVTVMMDHTGYEVTTYRIDGEYEDCRHPKDVVFTPDLSEDLKRRDFTINAMASDGSEETVDLFGGMDDLKNGIVKCVGEPHERFSEDALRILRAFRFSAQLGFIVDPETLKAANDLKENLKKVSAERIRTELNKTLLSKNPDRLFDMMEQGVTKVILPEFDFIVHGGADAKGLSGIKSGKAQSGMKAVKAVSLAGNKDLSDKKDMTDKQRLSLKWAALLSCYADTDIFTDPLEKFTEERGGDNPEDKYRAVSLTDQTLAADEKKKAKVREVMNRLKFDNETRDTVVTLVMNHTKKPVLVNDVTVRQTLRCLGKENTELLYELQTALCLADSFVSVGEINTASVKQLERIKAAKNKCREITERGDCYTVKQLAVNGRDLIDAGFPEGARVGEMLEFLLGKVIVDQTLNTKEKLTDIACLNF